MLIVNDENMEQMIHVQSRCKAYASETWPCNLIYLIYLNIVLSLLYSCLIVFSFKYIIVIGMDQLVMVA